MVLGPLEYTIIGFEGNEFNGLIADEIARVVDQGIISLVDAVVITKDAAGDIALLEIDNKDDPRFAGFSGLLAGTAGLLTPEDIAVIAISIPERTTALVLLFEHRWAVRVKQAIQGAGGFLISRTTISPEALELVNAELEAETAELTA